VGTAGAALGLLAACVDLGGLGGGVPPPADAPFDLAEAAPSAEASAAARFCGAEAGALFCDDFDDVDAAPGARWLGFLGVTPGVLLSGTGALTLGGPYPPVSPPLTLELLVDRNPGDSRSMAMLDQIVSSTQRGVEFAADVRQVELLDRRAPLDDGGTVPPLTIALLGLGVPSATNTVGASLRLGAEQLVLVAGVQTSTTEWTSGAVIPFGFVSAMRATWIRIHLAVGERDAVSARLTAATGASASLCPTTKAVAATWASLPLGSAACITLADDLVPLAGRSVAAVLGTTLEVPARARVQIDNARVDGIP
jgi:hypothetical protein